MKRIISLFLVSVVLLAAGCTGANNSAQSQQNSVQGSDTADSTKKSDDTGEANESEDNEKSDSGSDTNINDSEKETGSETEKETANETKAPLKEEVEGGVKFIFEEMPKSSDEIGEIADFKDEKYVAALFLAALVGYFDDKDECIEMINVLKGPQALSEYDINFINSQLIEKPYLPTVYFEGATPENNYTPDEPWSLIIYEDTREPDEEGYIRVFVKTSGADSPRAIKLRQKGEEWFIWEYPGILMGVRLPAKDDVWK